MNIFILRFYGYIGYIEDISTNNFTQNVDDTKIDKNLQ